MILVHLLLLLNHAYSVFSEEGCASEDPCRCVLKNNSAIDLSSVGSPQFPRFYQVSFEESCNTTTDLYSFNPCYAFDSSDKHTDVKDGYKPCTGAAVCQRTPGGHGGQFPEEHVIGLQDSAKFLNISNELYITYTAPGLKVPVRVHLVCNNKNASNILELENCPDENTDEIVLKLISKCACADGCKSVIPTDSPSQGLSVGSKLLIAFFTIFLAYFVIGFIWNFCNGSQGLELIPNFEFWNDLPTLIMEGVVFTCSFCGRERTYGEV